MALRAAVLLAAVGAGVVVAAIFGLTEVDESFTYTAAVATLLGFGLYASATGIHTGEFRVRWRTVLIAVTLGVLAKAALIFGALFLVFRDPSHAILAIAVAQIDPLSVAAVRAKSRMSESAKALLSAWAAFDDPITVLLTVWVTAFALRTGVGAGLGSFALGLLWNALLALGVYVMWRLWPRGELPRAARFAVWTVAALGLAAVAFVAVGLSLYLALALIGLFLRPRIGVDRAAEVAVVLATFAVGLVLVAGVSLVEGVVLGVAAYAAQIVVALVLTLPKMWRGDRMRLALGQQNGMTAIVLALMLEPNFPGTIAIVAPAIVTVNVLHAVCNAAWDHFTAPREVSPLVPTPNVAARAEPAG